MADKKRKGAVSVPTPPTKKSKKSSATESVAASTLIPAPSTTNDAVAKSKTGRKRAADFLGDEEAQNTTASAAAQPIASAKNTKNKSKSTPAGNEINGLGKINGETTVETATDDEPSATALEVPGQPAVDNEIEGDGASGDEDEDQGAALLAGFDSDGEDLAEDQGDTSRTQPIPQFKKTSKKLRLAKEKGSDGPGTVYVGRVPHGFYEKQMRDYFSQFGTITRLRLSRNRQTGASKHFAFIEFESDEVAKIVAETMDNYLMFGHILKCKYAPSENLHPDVWKGANKKYRKIPHEKLQRQQLEAPKTQEQWLKKNEKEKKKRQQKAEKLKAIGYEYVVPELKDPAKVVQQREIEQEHGIPPATITNGEEPNAIAPPPSVPADEVALKKEKKEKKSKKLKADRAPELLTEGNLGARDAGPAAESAKISQNDEDKKNNIASADVTPGSSPTKSKKPKKSKKGASIATESSSGDFNSLQSIPVGIEAAPASVTDARPAVSLQSISTQNGVADAVLAGRKSDRKKAKRDEKDLAKARSDAATITPGTVSGLTKDKKEKLKGILKKKSMDA